MNLLESLPIPSEILAFALQVALGGLCVSATVLAVARLMRRRSEPLRYGILLTGVIGLLAVPALVGAGRGCQPALPWFTAQVEDEVIKVPAAMLPELLNRPVVDPPVAESSAGAGEIVGAGLLTIWILGTIIGMGRLLHALVKQSRTLAGSPWRAGFWTDERKAQLAQQLGLRRFPAVQLSPAVPMPMVIGIWRPTIALPEPAPAAWEQPQWEAVLLHEAAHIARGDPWAALAQRVAVVLFWWCPPVHVLGRRLTDLRENICDDCALQGSCDRIAYAELLVASAEHFLSLTAIPASLGLMNSARGGLEARVTRLLAKEQPTMTRLSLSGKLLGAAFLMAACLLTTAGTAISGGQPPAQKKTQIKIIVDGKEIDLSDPKLLEYIEAAQLKAAVDVERQRIRRSLGLKPNQPAGAAAAFDAEIERLLLLKPKQPAGPAKQPAKKYSAISPDGNLLWFGDDMVLNVIELKSGKVVGQPHLDMRFEAQGIRFTDDPRIEAIVKQAEAIKPGSGAEIRKALQAVPKDPKAVKPATQKPGAFFMDTTGGKKVIVFQIEDGKLLQLHEEDLKKHIDKVIRLQGDGALPKQKETHTSSFQIDGYNPNIGLIGTITLNERNFDIARLKTTEKAAEKKTAPMPLPTDVEALSRQLERLNAEVIELRKRLEAGKK